MEIYFVQTSNLKYNIYLPEYSQEHSQSVEFDLEDEKKEVSKEDEKIFGFLDKVLSGPIFEKWMEIQEHNL